jgi:large subunit ribosomal protein L22
MSTATLKFIRLSPTKARLVAREVQGMNAEMALAALEFMPNKAAGIISKVIASAVANGEYEPEEVTILSCRVDKGPVLRRFRPRARGSASRILKPTSHIFVEVGTVVEEEKKKAAPAKSEKKVSEPAKEEPTEKKPASKAKKGTDLNDLKLLSGVGPAMEKKLNAEGITSINHIAEMSKEEIADLDAKIGIRGKIEDTWQKEAQELIKNNEKES